ncbi:hypothetical protein BH20ACT14_BH20ACT14_10410 [soil metagenome]
MWRKLSRIVSVSAWEAVFMLVVLKIPIVYLCGVVWWAIRSEPSPEYGAAGGDSSAPVAPCGWDDSRRRARSPVGTRPFPHAPRPSPRSRVGASS